MHCAIPAALPACQASTGFDLFCCYSEREKMCRKFIVSGRVQGVFFRASTRESAVPLGINGHAINLPDGTVEVVACGGDAAVEELRRWLLNGPRMASVEQVREIDCTCGSPEGFSTA